MPGDAAAVTALEAELQELRDTAATLQSHKEHFEGLVRQRDDESESAGFFASLAGALHSFVSAVEHGLFGDEDQPATPDTPAQPKTAATPFQRALTQLRGNAADSTDADRTDTLAHLKQVTAEIQARLDSLAAQIAQREAQLASLKGTTETVVQIDEPPPPTPRPVRRDDADEPEVVEPDTPTIIPIPVLPTDGPTVVVTPSTRPDAPFEPVVDPVAPAPPFHHIDIPIPQPDPTPSFVPGEQVEIGELAGEAYDVDAMLRAGKSVADLKARDIPAGVLTAFGVSTSMLLAGGYAVTELREAGITADGLRAAGASLLSLRDGGYTLDELRQVASVSELKDIASLSDLRTAGFDVHELVGVFTPTELATTFGVHELKSAGLRPSELRLVYGFAQLRDAYDLHELSDAFSASELHANGVSAGEMIAAGFPIAALQQAGYSYHDLQNAGASPSELNALYPGESSQHGSEYSDAPF